MFVVVPPMAMPVPAPPRCLRLRRHATVLKSQASRAFGMPAAAGWSRVIGSPKGCSIRGCGGRKPPSACTGRLWRGRLRCLVRGPDRSASAWGRFASESLGRTIRRTWPDRCFAALKRSCLPCGLFLFGRLVLEGCLRFRFCIRGHQIPLRPKNLDQRRDRCSDGALTVLAWSCPASD
jgi:hypothetical protein